MDFNGKKVLVTTSNWFFAPDGRQYKQAWGTVKICKFEDLLGVKPYNYANWFLVFNDILLIAGCQIHYAIVCDDRPASEEVFNAENYRHDKRWI